MDPFERELGLVSFYLCPQRLLLVFLLLDQCRNITHNHFYPNLKTVLVPRAHVLALESHRNSSHWGIMCDTCKAAKRIIRKCAGAPVRVALLGKFTGDIVRSLVTNRRRQHHIMAKLIPTLVAHAVVPKAEHKRILATEWHHCERLPRSSFPHRLKVSNSR